MTLSGLLRRRRAAVRPTSAAPAAFRSESRTHVGRVRAVNEDRLLDRADRGLWAVADGMGGHSAGADAATTVIDALRTLADGAGPIDADAVADTLAHANCIVHDRNRRAEETSGATAVVALMRGRIATILWAGDSRAYRIRGGIAEPLTRDHSFVQEMVDAGLLAAEAAERHPQANIVTRALGVAATILVDRVDMVMEAGDRLLLCSDGLSRSIGPRDFASAPAAVADIADRCLTRALQRDGSDNITVIVIAAD